MARLPALPLLLLLLSGCLFPRYERLPPASATSRRPWASSLNTGLPLEPPGSAAGLPAYDGYPDHRVLALRRLTRAPADSYPLTETPVDSLAAAHAARRAAQPAAPSPADDEGYFGRGATRAFVTPGVVWMYDVDLWVDEVEVSNLEWQHFVRYVEADSGREAAARYQPQAAALPLAGYFSDPFYRYYPVVGISREQAVAYCRWRSAITTRALAQFRQLSPTHPDYLLMTYRLPTEAEWEHAAGPFPEFPYGWPHARSTLRVNPKAAAYLRRRAGASQSVAQMEADIRAFNRASPALPPFNCQRAAPYFLALPTPGYVFDLPLSFFGLYHMVGNAAELVQEPGIVKGGSYRDSLAACAIRARGRYTGPAPTVGFRCVCALSFPNRR